jgi:hypothetical protein
MTKNKFFALADKHGMATDYEVERGSMVWLQVWAPEGKVFRASGSHVDSSLTDYVNATVTAADWPKAYAALQQIIEQGFDTCPDGIECDVCHEYFEGIAA